MNARQRAVLANERRAAVWQFTKEGYSETWIAERLGISQPRVSVILREVREAVDARMVTEAALVRVQLDGQLEQNIQRLAELFEASKGPKREQRMRRAGGLRQQGRPEGADIELLESKVEERIGDTAILEAMRKHIETRGKLWGAFAPTKVAPTNPAGDKPYEPADVELTDAEIKRRLKAALAAAEKAT